MLIVITVCLIEKNNNVMGIIKSVVLHLAISFAFTVLGGIFISWVNGFGGIEGGLPPT